MERGMINGDKNVTDVVEKEKKQKMKRKIYYTQKNISQTSTSISIKLSYIL